MTSPVPFEDVLNEELTYLEQKRKWQKQGGDTPPERDNPGEPKTARQRAGALKTFGLALSGGGIRSATFCLGVLQALAECRLLRLVDYLSTVSGGGYIGGWLATWVKREGSLTNVEKQLRPNRQEQARAKRHIPGDGGGPDTPPGAGRVFEEEPEPIYHLRSFSSYLTPVYGLFSADTWTFVGIYLRNFILNLLMLLPLAVVFVLLGRLALWAWQFSPEDIAKAVAVVAGKISTAGVAVVAMLLLCWVFFFSYLLTLSLEPLNQARKGEEATPPRPPAWRRVAAVLLTPYAWLSNAVRWLADRYPLPGLLVPLLAAVVLLCWLFLLALGGLIADGMAAVAVLLLCWVFLFAHWQTLSLKPPRQTRKGEEATPAAPEASAAPVAPAWRRFAVAFLTHFALVGKWVYGLPNRYPLHFLLIPLLLAAILLCWLFTPPLGEPDRQNGDPWSKPPQTRFNDHEGLAGLLNPWTNPLTHDLIPKSWLPCAWARWRPALAFGLFFGLLHLLANLVTDHKVRLTRLVVGLGSGLFGGLLFYVVVTELLWPLNLGKDAGVLVLGPPLVLLVYVLAQVCELGLLGTHIEEYEREWWARVAAGVLILAAGWLALGGLCLYGGWFIAWLPTLDPLFGHAALAVLTALWAAISAGGARAGWSPRTLTGRGDRRLEWLGQIGPPVFVIGLLAGVSWLTMAIVAPHCSSHSYWKHILTPEWARWGLAFGICALLFVLLIWRVDANLYSMNAAYANRLIRCYLGASRAKPSWRRWGATPSAVPESDTGRGGAPTDVRSPERMQNLVTGFDPHDDLALRDLLIETPKEKKEPPSPQQEEAPLESKPYRGPFLLINTALNLVGGDELAWQERKAESFVLTPLYCGSKGTGYRELKKDTHHLTLGRALAISGAAVSPNMGYHSSPALTALMTVFNLRLGWWLMNPNRDNWKPAGPNRGFQLFRELFSLTNEKSKYVYLSDGGHFENLGVYELIRRRCRYIVVCDADADPRYEFEDLANLIRKVRTDLGVSIEIDVGPIRPQAATGHSQWHCAVGKIYYGDVDCPTGTAGAGKTFAEREAERRKDPGILLYLKASLTGDELPDVLYYATAHSSFPHQSTLDQFFTESQFESYRLLGYHIGRKVFYDASRQLPGGDDRGEKFLGALFKLLEKRWFPPPPEYTRAFLESTRAFIAMEQEVRKGPHLERLSRALYPDLRPSPATPPEKATEDQLRAERHMFAEMLQTLEDVWLVLNLDDNWDHQQNRGWKEVFGRWTRNDCFTEHWEKLREEFSENFVNFIKRVVRLEKPPDSKP